MNWGFLNATAWGHLELHSVMTNAYLGKELCYTYWLASAGAVTPVPLTGHYRGSFGRRLEFDSTFTTMAKTHVDQSRVPNKSPGPRLQVSQFLRCVPWEWGPDYCHQQHPWKPLQGPGSENPLHSLPQKPSSPFFSSKTRFSLSLPERTLPTRRGLNLPSGLKAPPRMPKLFNPELNLRFVLSMLSSIPRS